MTDLTSPVPTLTPASRSAWSLASAAAATEWGVLPAISTAVTGRHTTIESRSFGSLAPLFVELVVSDETRTYGAIVSITAGFGTIMNGAGDLFGE
jgi:hypothetical protein